MIVVALTAALIGMGSASGAIEWHRVGDFGYWCETEEKVAVLATNYGSAAIIDIASRIDVEQNDGSFVTYDVTGIHDDTFYYDENIIGVYIQEGVTSIGEDAFGWCTNMRFVELPSTLKAIGDYAFYNCTKLEDISIPDGVTTINYASFGECRILASVSIPDSVTEIDSFAFSGCQSLSALSIPDSVASIHSGAFQGSGLTSISLPSTVTYWGEGVFADCTRLTSVSLPSNLQLIPGFMFDGCAFTSISIPSSVTTIGNYAFSRCPLTDVSIPSSVTKLWPGVFAECKNLTSVTIPSSIGRLLPRSVFEACSSLTDVNLANGIEIIHHRAFYGCSALQQINLPNTIESISAYAFYGCSSLPDITLPPGILWIGDYAFQGCSRLGSMTISASVNEIGIGTFADCTSLSTVTIASDLEWSSGILPQSIFKGCSALTEVNLANGISVIGEEAFYGCSALEEISIPSTVTSIGSYAFRDCVGLTSIAIPSEVSSIGSGAFTDCIQLSTCLFHGDAPQLTGSPGFPLSNFVINYHYDRMGFTTPPWDGYPVEPLKSRAGVAFVIKVKGDVYRIRGGKMKRLKPKDPIYLGDAIVTRSRSFVKLELNDESVLSFGPRSAAVLNHDPSNRTRADIFKGTLKLYKSRNSSVDFEKLIIKTKTAAIGVRGTTLTVEVSELGGLLTTHSEFLEGLVEYENLITGEVSEYETSESATTQAPVVNRTLIINHPSPALGSLSLNGVELTNFPHVVSYSEGTELDLVATPSATATFANWSGDSPSASSDYTLFLNQDTTLTAEFLEWTDFASTHPSLHPTNNGNGDARSNFLNYASSQDPEGANTQPILVLRDGILTLHSRVNALDAIPILQYSDNLENWFSLEEDTHYTEMSTTVEGSRRTQVIELFPGQASARNFRQGFGL